MKPQHPPAGPGALRPWLVAAIALAAIHTAGCATPAAFSDPTPGGAMLQDETSWYYGDAATAMAGASMSPRPTLALRIANLIDTYTLELSRAEAASNAWLPRAFTIAMVALPLSGTVGALVLPSNVATPVSASAGSATSILALTSLFYDPREGLTRAKTCAAFLRNALETLGQRWDRNALDSIEETPREWEVYLALRSGLDAGRHASCPDPTPAREWGVPWKSSEDEEAEGANFE